MANQEMLDRLNELAKRESLTNKYLVELFYGDDFEDEDGYWQETARCTSATDALNFLNCDLMEGIEASKTRITNVETDEVVYEFDENEFRDGLVQLLVQRKEKRGTYANN